MDTPLPGQLPSQAAPLTDIDTVKQTLDKREYYNQYNVSPIPYHTHNGTDSSIVDKTANGILIDVLVPSQSGNSGKVLQTNGTSVSWANLSALKNSFTAADNITAGQAVIIGIPSNYTTINQTTYNTTYGIGPNIHSVAAQTFLTTSKAKAIYSVTVAMAGTGNMIVGIYAVSGGFPTGSALGSGTFAVNGTTSMVECVFSSPITVSPSTTYAIYCSSGNNLTISYQNTDVYANGNMSHKDDNTSQVWTADSTYDFGFGVKEIQTTAGQISPANTTIQGDLSDNFIGFASAAITAGNSGVVVVGGIMTGLSGLTTGVTYYLQDTAGAIGSSAGSVSRKIGLALSSTTLLIKFDNP